MEPIKLSIVPIPKPRMTRSDAWKKRACVVRYWAYKDKLKLLWDREVPDRLHLIFTMPMPDSWSKKKQLSMIDKPHQSKPDIDNLTKAFLDALLDDDAAIWDVRATKYWGRSGSIEVKELGEN